jgi:hypothetical protein
MPLQGGAHGDNNLTLLYNYSKQLVTMKCLHPSCVKALEELQAELVMFQFSPASAEVQSASSLHDYAEKVFWAVDYDEPKMRPYPTDKGIVVSIVAGMGLGELCAAAKQRKRHNNRVPSSAHWSAGVCDVRSPCFHMHDGCCLQPHRCCTNICPPSIRVCCMAQCGCVLCGVVMWLSLFCMGMCGT